LEAEFEMASIAVDPVNNAEFSSFKGSTPARVDAPVEKHDACNKLVLDSLANDNFWVLNPFTSAIPTGSILSGIRCSPSRAIPP
jgi:hypothetical protein